MLEPQNNDQLTIKLLLPGEIDRIFEIQQDCNLSFWSHYDYEQGLQNPHTLIYTAKTDGKIVGFIASRLLLKGIVSESEGKDAMIYSEAEILNFGVLGSYRKRGIGSLLLKEFLQCVLHKSILTVWLEVRDSNASAIEFYFRKGFVKSQKRKNFYSLPTEDAIVMKLLLSASVE